MHQLSEPTARHRFLRVTLNSVIFPLVLVGAMTIIQAVAVRYTSLEFNSILYLIPVVISAMRWGIVPAMVAAFASVAVSDFFFLPPLYSFWLNEPRQAVDLALFLFVALVTGNLAAKLQREADSSHRRENEVHNLYLLSRRLALCSTASDLVEAIQDYLTSHLGCRAFLIRPPYESAEGEGAINGPLISSRLRAEVPKWSPARTPARVWCSIPISKTCGR